MNDYLVTVLGRYFSIYRIVRADSRAAAAAQVNQQGALLVWVDDPERCGQNTTDSS